MAEVYENCTALENICTTQDYFLYGNYELSAMNNQDAYSPFNESQTTSSMSPLNEFISLKNATAGEAHLTILEQPIEKFRFRYKSEMIGTHGCLVGSNSNSSRKKNAPTVQLHNYPETAIIRCTLVTSDEGQRIPHAHKLVYRDGGIDYDEPHDVKVSPETGYIATFHGLGIIHTAKKHVKDVLIEKMRKEALEVSRRKNPQATLSTREEAQIKADAEDYQKCMKFNSVALRFQAFILDKDDVAIPITKPIYSHTINNLKSALTGELKICRIDKFTSSVEGNEEVFILVEKVGKKNIRIKFFEKGENDSEIWHAYGRFSELDVHHQYAIVFKTPQYRDLTITSPKEVFIQLERPSDADCSEPLKFTYKPSDRIIGKKRQRMSYSSSSELSHIVPTFHNFAVENISGIPSSDSRDVSRELKKMLADSFSSSTYKDILESTDLEQYISFIENNDKNMLTADGPSTKQNEDDTMFAQNVLTEVIKCMEMDLKDRKEHVQNLLKNRSTYGDTPLHAALRYGQRDIVKYILMLISADKDCKTLVNGRNSSGKTPLHYAVLQNLPEVTKALLMLGADPNQIDEHGFSPLHAAVRIPDGGACVDALLTEKANTEVYNDAGWTALHLATEAGAYDAVRSLVQAGVDVNSTDMSYGRTALHIAVEGGHKDIAEFLLKKTSIDVNKRNFSGNTALHTAVVSPLARAKELCELLVQYGADPYIQNHHQELDSQIDKRKACDVHIKEEINSEDENIVGTTGQSSFDLAMNKPEILQLLNGKNEETTNDMCSVTTKLKIEDKDVQTNWLNNEQKKNLAVLLNKTQGWKKLAKHLKFEYLLKSFEHSSSSSLLLLNYIAVQESLSLVNMKNLLKDIGEEEAANYIHEILSPSE